MFTETKDTVFEELETIIRIMNQEQFYMNVRGATDRSKIKNRAGSKKVIDILKRHMATTLYELTKKQLEDEIVGIHQTVITANLKGPDGSY